MNEIKDVPIVNSAGAGLPVLQKDVGIREFEPMEGGRLTVHFQSLGKDGISLQLQLHNDAIGKFGIPIHNCCSDLPDGSQGLKLEELNWHMPEVVNLRERIFKPDPMNPEDEDDLWVDINKQSKVIKDEVLHYIKLNDIRMIDVYNIFTMPFNPAATWAFYELALENPELHFVDHISDLRDENEQRREQFPPIPYSRIADNFNKALIPDLPNMKHVAISEHLAHRASEIKGVKVEILTDVVDFDYRLFPVDRSEFRKRCGIGENDLVFGMTSRVIPRKGYELAIQFLSELKKRKDELAGIDGGIGPNRVKFKSDSNIYLVIFNDEDRQDAINSEYFTLIKKYANDLGVEIIDVGNQVVADSIYETENSEKIPFYSTNTLYDGYLFPSIQEGNGNNLIEAVAFSENVVPIVLENQAYRNVLHQAIPNIISLGVNDELDGSGDGLKSLRKTNILRAVNQVVNMLRNPAETDKLASENKKLARKKFGIEHNLEKLVSFYQKNPD